MKKEARKVNMLEGDGFPIRIVSQGRNQKCQCGSGKKSKDCCGVKVNANYTNPADKLKRKLYTFNKAKSLIIGRWYTIRRIKYEFWILVTLIKKKFAE